MLHKTPGATSVRICPVHFLNYWMLTASLPTFAPEVIELLDDVDRISDADLHLVGVTWYKTVHAAVSHFQVMVRRGHSGRRVTPRSCTEIREFMQCARGSRKVFGLIYVASSEHKKKKKILGRGGGTIFVKVPLCLALR